MVSGCDAVGGRGGVSNQLRVKISRLLARCDYYDAQYFLDVIVKVMREGWKVKGKEENSDRQPCDDPNECANKVELFALAHRPPSMQESSLPEKKRDRA